MTTLAEAAKAYRGALPGDVNAFAVEGIDRLGVPVRISTLKLPDGWQYDGFGYGATPDEALVGALGELTEGTFAELWLRTAPRVAGTYRELVAERGPGGVADPLTLCLPAGSAYSADTPLQWVGTTRWPTGEPVLVPLEFAATNRAQMRGAEPLFQPITNGLGAGTSREQALAHGLLELLQRDGNCTAFRALDQGAVIDADGLRPKTAALLAKLRAAGLNATPKLAATDFGMVNVTVVGDDRGQPAFPMMLTACGEAVHPDRDRAVRKALLEYAAARSRKAFMHGPFALIERVAPPGYLSAVLADLDPSKEEPRSLAAMTEWCGKSAEELRALLGGSVFAERSRVPLRELPTAGAVDDPAARLDLVGGRLRDAGHDVLYFDFAPPGGVFAVKAVVTGLECETLSYHRIGERGVRRLLERGDRFVGRGHPPAGALPVRLTAEAEARLGGPAWLDPAAIDAIVGPLYPLYREPNSHTVQLALARAPR